VLASGCGQAAPDLFQVTRSGADRNANVDLVVNDAGSATCNRTIHKPISSEQLIDAREIARDLGELAKLDIDLPKGTGATLHYKARSDLGTVAWWDTSPGQDTTLAKLTRFTKDIAEDVCGLAR
jgi:hypothetical protein